MVSPETAASRSPANPPLLDTGSDVVWVSVSDAAVAPDRSLGNVTPKAGQRLPTEKDAQRLDQDRTRTRIDRLGGFPHAACWRLTEARAALWLSHRLEQGWGGHKAIHAMLGDEFGLLLSDLDCYAGLVQRGRDVPPLLDYLREGREDGAWGVLFDELRQLLATQDLPPTTRTAVLEGTGLFEARDAALWSLACYTGADAADLAPLNVGDVDLDGSLIRIGGAWQPLPAPRLHALECYLDLRPDTPERPGLRDDDPLWISREGERLSVRQLRRVLASRGRARV